MSVFWLNVEEDTLNHSRQTNRAAFSVSKSQCLKRTSRTYLIETSNKFMSRCKSVTKWNFKSSSIASELTGGRTKGFGFILDSAKAALTLRCLLMGQCKSLILSSTSIKTLKQNHLFEYWRQIATVYPAKYRDKRITTTLNFSVDEFKWPVFPSPFF